MSIGPTKEDQIRDETARKTAEIYERLLNSSQENNSSLRTRVQFMHEAISNALKEMGEIEDVQAAYKAGDLAYRWCNRIVRAQQELLNALQTMEMLRFNDKARKEAEEEDDGST